MLSLPPQPKKLPLRLQPLPGEAAATTRRSYTLRTHFIDPPVLLSPRTPMAPTARHSTAPATLPSLFPARQPPSVPPASTGGVRLELDISACILCACHNSIGDGHRGDRPGELSAPLPTHDLRTTVPGGLKRGCDLLRRKRCTYQPHCQCSRRTHLLKSSLTIL